MYPTIESMRGKVARCRVCAEVLVGWREPIAVCGDYVWVRRLPVEVSQWTIRTEACGAPGSA